MVDSAVTRFGRWAEGKLQEHDDQFKPKWTLEQIFNEPEWAVTEQPIGTGGDDWAAFLDGQGGSF